MNRDKWFLERYKLRFFVAMEVKEFCSELDVHCDIVC